MTRDTRASLPSLRAKVALVSNTSPTVSPSPRATLEHARASSLPSPLVSDDCAAEAMLALQSMFGVDQVPTPERVIVTRWGGDPYARGSYSFVQVKVTLDAAPQAPLSREFESSMFSISPGGRKWK